MKGSRSWKCCPFLADERDAAAAPLAGTTQHYSPVPATGTGPASAASLVVTTSRAAFAHAAHAVALVTSVTTFPSARISTEFMYASMAIATWKWYTPRGMKFQWGYSHHLPSTEDLMNVSVTRRAAVQALLILASLICTGCATTGGAVDEGEPVSIAEASVPQQEPETPVQKDPEGEVPLVVAESEHPESVPPAAELEEVIVEAARPRHEVILDLVSEAQSILRDVELQYVFTGKGRKEVLRGRPVAFALWSEATKAWSIAHIEIPRPPVKWKPGRKPLPFLVRTPGIEARHGRARVPNDSCLPSPRTESK